MNKILLILTLSLIPLGLQNIHAELPCVTQSEVPDISENNFCNWLEYLSGDPFNAIIIFHSVHDQVKLESKILKTEPKLEEFTFTSFEGEYVEKLVITKIISMNTVDSVKLYNGTITNLVLVTDNPLEILNYYNPVEDIPVTLIPITELDKMNGTFEFQYYTGEIFQINYWLKDAILTKLSTDPGGTIRFNVNSTNGELFVSFPKAIPLEYQEGLDYPLFVAVLDGDGRYAPLLETDTKITQTANECTFELKIELDNEMEKEIQININHGQPIAGPRLTYVDLPEKCLVEDSRNDTKIQRQLNEKQCSNSNYKKGLNIRDELVCISPESYPWLNQRGYMKTFSIIK